MLHDVMPLPRLSRFARSLSFVSAYECVCLCLFSHFLFLHFSVSLVLHRSVMLPVLISLMPFVVHVVANVCTSMG